MLTCLVGSLAWTSAALADNVVDATIYPGGGGSLIYRGVTLDTLQGCKPYDGSESMTEDPGSNPFQPVPGYSWSLSTVITCGLNEPLPDGSTVRVLSERHGFEDPLTPAELGQGAYDDPTAFPVISVNGAGGQVTYLRPQRTPADQNAADVVGPGGAVSISIYASGAVLTVKASATKPDNGNVSFSATVADSNGNPVPASALSWDWTFGDGQGLSTPAPTHDYGTETGNFVVTVNVSDTATGSGGTDTIDVPITSQQQQQTPPPPPGHQKHPGNNNKGGNTGKTGNGKHTNGNGNNGSIGNSQTGGLNPQSNTNPSGTNQTPGITGPGTHNLHNHRTPTAHTATTPTTPTPKPPRTTTSAGGTGSSSGPSKSTSRSGQRTSSTQRSHSKTPGGQAPKNPLKTPTATATKSQPPLVTGLLVSDVTPLPPGASPLIHEQSAAKSQAPALRRTVTTSSVTGIAAAITVVMIFALGAARELRGQRRRRILRLSD